MILVGTSGYNYSEWKGSFYPEDLSSSKMLPYYADRFHTVEINYSFYRLPSEKAVSGWADQTPDDFVFTLKASRRITHDARLRDCKELVDVFCERGRRLGDKLGTILFQLPPWAPSCSSCHPGHHLVPAATLGTQGCRGAGAVSRMAAIGHPRRL